MGGYGSGRQGGRPLADEALFIEIDWMVRTRKAVPGSLKNGTLSWTCRGKESGWIGYKCDMRDPENASLTLRFTVTICSTGEKHNYEQRVRLSSTSPHFGGRRWWMHCPANGSRVGKLYCPAGYEKFASRTAWGLGYQSQRVAHRDRLFEKLFRLQNKLGCDQGWESPLYRPKGMWKRTYERHLRRYWELDEQCAFEMAIMMRRLAGIGDFPKWLE